MLPEKYFTEEYMNIRTGNHQIGNVGCSNLITKYENKRDFDF